MLSLRAPMQRFSNIRTAAPGVILFRNGKAPWWTVWETWEDYWSDQCIVNPNEANAAPELVVLEENQATAGRGSWRSIGSPQGIHCKGTDGWNTLPSRLRKPFFILWKHSSKSRALYGVGLLMVWSGYLFGGREYHNQGARDGNWPVRGKIGCSNWSCPQPWKP